MRDWNYWGMTRRGFVGLLASGALGGIPALALAFSPAQTGGRLPKAVVPTDYTIALVPHLDSRTITGRETIVVRVEIATDTIRFNSLNEVLRDVRLDGKAVRRVVSSDADQLTTITLRRPASVGTHTLTFDYSGRIESGPVGLFAQPYTSRGGAHSLLLSTQMEATDARRMFPCWDEPAFRATFQLSVTLPSDWDSVSNMPVATRQVKRQVATTTYERTPKMPSYLVELTAGKLGKISGVSDGIEFGLWAVRGSEKDGATALADAQTILADYNQYFGYRFPLPKLDSIAVPGGFQGAMENWGAITYSDQLLLLSGSSGIKNRQEVYETEAHEIAHQWNGDLVTMAWWDDIWLNESFASWMAAKETDLRNPDWKWWEVQDAGKEDAMSADARSASHPIQQHVTNELQAINAFDPQITYLKGESILRMLEAYLGPDVFRAGIRIYMQAFAFSNATTADLWASLSQASGNDVGAIAGGWTEQAGFPLVTVAASCDLLGARTVTLSQRRFLLRPDDKISAQWKIPLQIRVGVAAQPQPVLLTQDSQSAAAGQCDDPLSINAGALGFYRTRYDPATLQMNTKNFGHLPEADRIALLDDQWALVESGIDPLQTYLALAASMESDLDARAWTQIASALGVIEYAERDQPGHSAFATYARSILAPAFERLGWDAKPRETPDVQTLRQTLIRELGSLDDERIITGARRRFSGFLADRASMPPSAQEAILAVVAEHADAKTFQGLRAIARGSKDETEMRRYYGALMAVKDPVLARQAVQSVLSSAISPQADALRVELIMQLADRHPALSWTVFTENHVRLLKPFAGEAPLIIAQYIPATYWSAIPAAQIETWTRSHLPADLQGNVDRAMETVRFRSERKDLLVSSADALLHK